MSNNVVLRIIRKPETIKKLGISKSTLHIRINDGLIPPPVSLGARAVGFIEHEIQAVIEAIVAEKSKDELKTLVCMLITQRKKAA
ncbi:MAG: AlpA family phage regulatory protein [Algicola sp.]|nr:AlpA family phage regulatory protein [Algicola sp.]